MIEFACKITDRDYQTARIIRHEYTDDPITEYVLPALNSTLEYRVRILYGWHTLVVRVGNEIFECPLLLMDCTDWMTIANWPNHPYQYTHVRITG